MKALQVVVSGRVQGVWFRGWMRQEARALGLDGWVRNRFDGSVEALFSGPDAAVEAMVAACGEGPPAARVDEVRVETAVAPIDAGFRVLPNT
jgi:acylphosphatase